MGSVIGDILPLALGIAISPIPIIAAILMLLSPKAKGTSVGFLIGCYAGFRALFKAEKYMGQEVVARGWYRRAPGPVIEPREVWASDGTRSRSWEWMARFAASGLVLFAGVVVMLVSLA